MSFNKSAAYSFFDDFTFEINLFVHLQFVGALDFGDHVPVLQAIFQAEILRVQMLELVPCSHEVPDAVAEPVIHHILMRLIQLGPFKLRSDNINKIVAVLILFHVLAGHILPFNLPIVPPVRLSRRLVQRFASLRSIERGSFQLLFVLFEVFCQFIGESFIFTQLFLDVFPACFD